MAHAFSPVTLEAEVGGSLWVWGRSGLQSELQDSQGCYKGKPCTEKTKKGKTNNKPDTKFTVALTPPFKTRTSENLECLRHKKEDTQGHWGKHKLRKEPNCLTISLSVYLALSLSPHHPLNFSHQLWWFFVVFFYVCFWYACESNYFAMVLLLLLFWCVPVCVCVLVCVCVCMHA